MNSLHSKLLIGGGIMMVIGPFCGLFTSVLGMRRGFSQLGSDNPADPRALAETVGHSLLFTAAGISIGLVGLATLLTGFILWLNSPERLATKLRRKQVVR